MEGEGQGQREKHLKAGAVLCYAAHVTAQHAVLYACKQQRVQWAGILANGWAQGAKGWAAVS